MKWDEIEWYAIQSDTRYAGINEYWNETRVEKRDEKWDEGY